MNPLILMLIGAISLGAIMFGIVVLKVGLKTIGLSTIGGVDSATLSDTLGWVTIITGIMGNIVFITVSFFRVKQRKLP